MMAALSQPVLPLSPSESRSISSIGAGLPADAAASAVASCGQPDGLPNLSNNVSSTLPPFVLPEPGPAPRALSSVLIAFATCARGSLPSGQPPWKVGQPAAKASSDCSAATAIAVALASR